MIHFVTVHLKEQVHAQALGFTDTIYIYCWGSDAAQAEQMARVFCAGSGIKFDRCSSATVAREQNPGRYTFPEQIYGLPLDDAERAIRDHDFGEKITNDTLITLRKNREKLRRGEELLAAAA